MVANMSMARSAVLAIGGRRIGRRSISPDQPTLWDVRVPLQKASFDKLRMRKKGAENSGLVLSLSKDVLRPEPLEEAKEKPNQPPNADLRRLVETLQRPAARVCRLGVPALDAALPDGGLALGRMHEVVAEDGEAGTGFAALLLARIAGKTGRVLWCGASLYGPGLAAFGLDPDRVIFARTAPGDETLWAMEEGLRCKGLSAVLGESPMLDLTAGRRLQLAAERQGVTAVFLRRPAANRQLRGQTRLDPSAATTRWRVVPLPRAPQARDHAQDCGARWRVELLRCRGGAPRDFLVDWCHATGDLAVAAAPGDGLAAPGMVAPPQSDAAD